MNIALISAGGVGRRANTDKPKQFMTVNGKTIIRYTLECFESHPDIDVIAVICVKGWEEFLHDDAVGITKLRHIIPGGPTGHSSICGGVCYLNDRYAPDDIILVHDGIRPLVSHAVITDCLTVTKRYGNATAVLRCPEVMLYTTNDYFATGDIDRALLRRTQTPQGYHLNELYALYCEMKSLGHEYIAPCAMFIQNHHTVFFSKGDIRNIKYTTADDLEAIKILLGICQ